MRLYPGLKPFTVEYSDITGDAALTVKWNDSGVWTVIQPFDLKPNQNLLTSRAWQAAPNS